MTIENYIPGEIESKWAKKWQEIGVYKAIDGDSRPKSYLLIEFPYPSGERLHVGHARSYSCMDAVARKRRMQGMNVLYPIGWDAFGLPAENYAIKTGIHPSITTAKNIANAKTQAISWGLSFDWEREVNTTDPKYYKWTQWIFVQLFKKGLAYKAEIAVNWCPSCKTNLANEEVIDGKCERCGTQTERRKQSQWILAITKYADRLLGDLDTVDYRKDIKVQQVNWIGKKEGFKIKFDEITVFTTRPDTLNAVTFIALAVDYPKLLELVTPEKRLQVDAFVKKPRLDESEVKIKEGVDTGLRVKNPLTGAEIPVWVTNYVMMDYGTGAVMGVPAHDSRDNEFASKYQIDILDQKPDEAIAEKIIENGWGEKTVSFHLRDWVFSRQHYWGEPIPMTWCKKCGWQPVAEADLPVKLPEIEKYQPSETGESPLSTVTEWLSTKCNKCGGVARRETDTMPNWAGSSWYFLRYIDPLNDSSLASEDKLKYWLPVDWYNGGMEHTTLHLLYSRFWHKFLYDLGVVPTIEPYAKRTSHGAVLGPDGKRMSKSRGNVINPDEVVNKFGADALRMYEMFMAPFDQMVAWSWESLEGVSRFLNRVWRLVVGSDVSVVSSDEAKNKIAKLISKIEGDIEAMKFNTAVAALMEWTNWWSDHKNEVGRSEVIIFVQLLAPLAPFLAEEMYQRLKNKSDKFESVHVSSWPVNESKTVSQQIKMVIQVDGKMRAVFEGEISEDGARALVQKYLTANQYKVVQIPGKVINFVSGGE